MREIWGCVDYSHGGLCEEDARTPSSGPVTGSFEFWRSLDNLAVAADLELHDRPSLEQALGISGSACREHSDIQLVLSAYRKWGDDCPRFINGEFAFAIWDTRLRRLFCCRDHLGSRRFYYWSEGQAFRFGSTPLTIFRTSKLARRLNRRKLAAMAITRGLHYHHEETFYSGIMALPPGTTLAFDGTGLRKGTYWTLEIKPDLVPRRAEDAFDALRDLLFRAVENRICGSQRAGTLLSGGLDSSAVTAIAAKCLEKRNRGLVAFSAVLPDERRPLFEDERSWIEEFRKWPNVSIEPVTAVGGGPFDLIEEPRNFEHSFLMSSLAFVDHAIEDSAINRGVGLALTGHAGEFGVTSNGNGYFLELLAGLHLPAAAKMLTQLKAKTGVSPFRLLARELVNGLFPERREWPTVYLAPAFGRECEARRLTARRHWPDHRKDQQKYLAMWQRRHAGVDHHRPGVALRYSSPFSDKSLLEFCLAAPGDMKIRDGYPRYLVRGALEGVLPESIRWRTSKGVASPDYTVRYAAQIRQAQEFLAAIGPNDPVRSVIDVDQLGRLVALRDPPSDMRVRMYRVPNTIYLICFLRQFADFRP
jgi:asparagine synthase (glutamine-hydrolysing)